LNLGNLIDLERKIEDAVDDLKDLLPGQQKVVPGLLKVRIHGTRWKLGVVLEKDAPKP
jgi:hypothetical protein